MGGMFNTPDIRITVREIQGSGTAPCEYKPLPAPGVRYP